MARALKPLLGGLLLLAWAAGAGAQTIGPDLLIPGTELPPRGALRIAAQLSGHGGRSYFSPEDGRTRLTDGLGGDSGALTGGIEALYSFSAHAAAFVSWLPGGVLASAFSADEQRRATGFYPLHAGAWVKLTGSDGLLRGTAAWPVDSGAALVVSIPFQWPDYERELERRNQGLSYTAENSGVRAWGFGYLLEAEWYPGPPGVSLWAAHDLLVFLPADYRSAGLREFEENRIWELLEETEAVDTIWYRYQLGFCAAPRLQVPTEAGTLWRLSLPLSFRYRPAPIFDGRIAVINTQEWQLDLGVQASVVLPRLQRHTELVVGYQAPVAGRNLRAEHRISTALIVDLTARSEL